LKPGIKNLPIDKQREIFDKQHRIPAQGVNKALTAIFNAETPIGHWLKFPWGTSILGVFEKIQ
jgi:hypothetical protein